MSNHLKDFVLELRNHFSVLSATTEEEDHDLDSKWSAIKNVYCETAKYAVGYRQKRNKEWLTPGTWQGIDERKQLKNKLFSS